LPIILKSKCIPLLFADDINVVISNPSCTDYENDLNQILKNINKWFKANLILNLDKTYFMQ
jgi:hypothetical protein